MRPSGRPVRFPHDVIPPPHLEADVSDPFAQTPGAGQADQPSEEEVRAYLSQLRETPVEQVVAEVLSALLNAAQVKLGRADGRLLLDLAAGLIEQGGEQLPEELTGQVDDVLAQLRVAQVDAEQQLAGAGGDAAAPHPGEEPAAPPASGPSDPPPSAGPSDPSSRLWVPGR